MGNKVFYAGGFLYNAKTNSVLLHLRDDKTPNNPGKWAFFGGNGEQGETPKGCLRRELKEELDLDVTEDQMKPVCDYLNVNRGTWRHIFYVQSSLDTSEMKLGEGADFKWIRLTEAFQYDLTDKTSSDLKTFLNTL